MKNSFSKPPHSNDLSRRSWLGSAVASTALASAQTTAGPAEKAAPTSSSDVVNPRLFTFIGGQAGAWSVIEAKAVVGEPLPMVDKVDIVQGSTAPLPIGARWLLRGATSNERYVDRAEKAALVAKQRNLGRPEANYGALIPIRKNAKWWSLTQEERRAIFESQSHHTEIGLKYLPSIARRLHHCRDLAESQPFDFITLFDYAKEDASAFDELVAALRESAEWKFVDREFDVRLRRDRA